VLKLFNSTTKRLEEFRPPDNANVKIFTCGPSIYQLPHIGNYRTFLYEDILVRYLEYLGYKVRRALFITDIEDKAIAEARKEGTTLKELTTKNTQVFLNEFKQLRAKAPTYIVKSSTSVSQAVELIQTLVKKDYAYWHEGNVYYDPLKFQSFGKLCRLDMSRWPKKKRRFHKDTYPGNRWNLGDFILWHRYQQEDKEACWNTSLGKGRPAWNVQDPAMALHSMGLKADIYCGDVDNMIRHHDYVIAVVEGVTGESFADYWLHGEHLLVDGKKMPKSRGNIICPTDMIERGCLWPHIRFFLINSHYRKRLNFTFEKFRKACDRLHRFKAMVQSLQDVRITTEKTSQNTRKLIAKLREKFDQNMNNDLRVKDAFDQLFKTVVKLASLKNKGKISQKDAEKAVATLRSIDRVLQVIF